MEIKPGIGVPHRPAKIGRSAVEEHREFRIGFDDQEIQVAHRTGFVGRGTPHDDHSPDSRIGVPPNTLPGKLQPSPALHSEDVLQPSFLREKSRAPASREFPDDEMTQSDKYRKAP